VLISLGVLGLVVALVGGGALWFLTDRYAGNIDRVSDVFTKLDTEARPAPATPAQEAGEQPVTFLLVETDSRATAEEGIADGGRSNAIPGHGMDKVNTAYAYGGPALLIQTVEQLTDVRIDHYVAIHFVDFFAASVLGTDTEGAASVVHRADVAGHRMWGHLLTDSLAQHAAEFTARCSLMSPADRSSATGRTGRLHRPYCPSDGLQCSRPHGSDSAQRTQGPPAEVKGLTALDDQRGTVHRYDEDQRDGVLTRVVAVLEPLLHRLLRGEPLDDTVRLQVQWQIRADAYQRRVEVA
jgi:cell envelope-related transcriptional attenuator-like protein